jgi:hypothetical protein
MGIVAIFLILVVVFTITLMSSSDPSSRPAISANDLFGVHDLVMVGYAAVFMTPHAAGTASVQSATLNLTEHLDTLHPVAECRAALLAAKTEGSSPLDTVVAAGRTAWGCLPGNFSEGDFTNPFTAAAVTDSALAMLAKFPTLNPPKVNELSTCAGSLWQRTCSYWSSIHTMALRAEQAAAPQLTKSFLPLLVATAAGGITQCRG